MFVLLLLIQLFKFKIIRIAACFLIVEGVEAHVGFLHLFGSIKKGVVVCCMVVTVTTISGVRTVPLERLRRLGFT